MNLIENFNPVHIGLMGEESLSHSDLPKHIKNELKGYKLTYTRLTQDPENEELYAAVREMDIKISDLIQSWVEEKAEEEEETQRKADEEAAAKKQQDEEAAAKKQQDEEAAAKKQQDDEAAAKKQEDEQAAAKKQKDDEAAEKKKSEDDKNGLTPKAKEIIAIVEKDGRIHSKKIREILNTKLPFNGKIRVGDRCIIQEYMEDTWVFEK